MSTTPGTITVLSSFDNSVFTEGGFTNLFTNEDDSLIKLELPEEWSIAGIPSSNLYIDSNGSIRIDDSVGRWMMSMNNLQYWITFGSNFYVTVFPFFTNDLVSTCDYKFINNNSAVALKFVGYFFSYPSVTFEIHLLIGKIGNITIYYKKVDANNSDYVQIGYIANDGLTTNNSYLAVDGTSFGNSINKQINMLEGLIVNFGVVPQAPTPTTTTVISVPSTLTKTFGDAPFSLGATSNSDAAISYSSSNTGVATVATDGTVTIVGQGLTTITTTQLANTNYTSASATTSITVNKKTLSISSPSSFSKTLGDSPFNIAASIVGEVSGSPVSLLYSVSVGKGSPPANVSVNSSGTVTILGIGTSTIQISTTFNSNYIGAFKLVTITVSLPPQQTTVISVPSTLTKIFGDAPFSLGATSNSDAAISYSSSNTGVATVATDGTVTIVGQGLTTITTTQLANTNYTSGSATTIITVSKSTPSNPVIVSSSTQLTYTLSTNTSNVALSRNLQLGSTRSLSTNSSTPKTIVNTSNSSITISR